MDSITLMSFRSIPIHPGLVTHVLLASFNGLAAMILFFLLSGTVFALSLGPVQRLGGRKKMYDVACTLVESVN